MDMTPTSNINRVEIFILEPLALKNTFSDYLAAPGPSAMRFCKIFLLNAQADCMGRCALGEHLTGC
jgi:hypothetical protein